MRLAPSRTRELSWRGRKRRGGASRLSSAHLSVCLSVYLSADATQFQSGANAAALKRTDGQTDRGMKGRLSAPPPPSPPPPSSHIWLGFFLVCFCHSLGCFWFGFIFGILLQKKCEACSRHSSVSRRPRPPGGFRVSISPLNKAPPPPAGVRGGSGGWEYTGGFQWYRRALTPATTPPHVFIVFKCLG